MQEYMRWPYGRCERILVPSVTTRDAMVRSKINPSKVGLWTRGVCPQQFHPAKRSAALRAQWNVSDQQPALLYVGRVSREKGLDLLPGLTERLQRLQFKHRLIIVGDGPMRGALSDRCTNAVFTGTLSHAEVAVAMASADCFVFPSRTDTAGNVVRRTGQRARDGSPPWFRDAAVLERIANYLQGGSAFAYLQVALTPAGEPVAETTR